MSAFGGKADIAKRANGKCPTGLKRDIATWRRFVCSMKSLPPDQAAPLWHRQ
jgi:hypothetical protein